MERKIITRRDFLRGTAGMAISATLSAGLPEAGRAEGLAKVILIRDANVLNKAGEIQDGVLQRMLDEAVKRMVDEKEIGPAWRRLFQKEDVVGIKSNVWLYLPTPRVLEAAIRRRLVEVGIAEKNISIDDRGVLRNPVFSRATALINVRPLRTHFWSGIGGCIKNYVMFVPNPSDYHDEACADLGKIWTYPVVKGKTRLNILCALTPQFYGRGPHFFDKRYVWPYRGLLVGTDPVALDAVGAYLLQRKRIAHFGEDRPLDAPPTHITAAEKKHRIGVADLSRIQIVRLGWMEEALL